MSRMLSTLVFILLLESTMQSMLRTSKSGKGFSSVQSHRLAAAMKDKSKSTILYVIRTWHANYDTLLPSILATWASPLESSSLLIVGDVDQSVNSTSVVAATGCPNDHQVGLTCKTAHSLALAADKIGSHSWVFVVDDDVYVDTSNLENELSKHDPSKLIALGIPGCGTPHCNDNGGGFCGGGGYAVSRAALSELVDKPTAVDFHDEMLEFMHEEYLAPETPWDDITTTCLMKQRGIAIESIEGLYGWRMQDSPNPSSSLSAEYQDAIQSSSPPPLTFHYIDSQEMYMIHKQFMDPAPQETSLLAIPSKYDEQMRQYIHDESVRRSEFIEDWSLPRVLEPMNLE